MKYEKNEQKKRASETSERKASERNEWKKHSLQETLLKNSGARVTLFLDHFVSKIPTLYIFEILVY